MPSVLAGRICSRHTTLALSGIGLAISAISVIDPRVSHLGAVGALASITAFLLARRAGHKNLPRHLFIACLSLTYSIVALCRPDWLGDSAAYYMYLRSVFFDGDLHFANEWMAFGHQPRPLTATGLPLNVHSIGPAILWSPFFFLAHVYVLALHAVGIGRYGINGYSVPYLYSTALGSAAAVVAGGALLVRAFTSRFGRAVAAVAVIGTTLTSTIPYYVFIEPAMAHAAVFGASAAFVWAWIEADREPSLRGWIRLAVLLGLVSLARWQALALGFMFLPLLSRSLRRGVLRWWWPLVAAVTSLLVFIPQLIVWRILFGSFLAAPAQHHGIDWSSPHFLKVLLSANHGLLAWSPATLVALLGWLLLLRSWRTFALGALAVFTVTTWINGCVAQWWGAAAFGARRFDLVIPLLAGGMAAAIAFVAREISRRPLLVPAFSLGLLFLWNVGLMRFSRNRVFAGAAPLDELAQRQVSLVRRISESALEHVGGPQARNLAYMFFTGRYFYVDLQFDGLIDVQSHSCAYLSGGWSDVEQRPAWGRFRWALAPRACVRVPLDKAFDLHAVVTARVPEALQDQVLTFYANQEYVGARPVAMEWEALPFDVPAAALHPGENLLCLGFSRHPPDSRAAAIKHIQLP